MSRKVSTYTVAEIAEKRGVSESTVLRAIRGVTPFAMVDGYQGRRVKAYSKEQIAAAFPKVAKRKVKA